MFDQLFDNNLKLIIFNLFLVEQQQADAKLIDLGDDNEQRQETKPQLTKQAPLAQPDDRKLIDF